MNSVNSVKSISDCLAVISQEIAQHELRERMNNESRKNTVLCEDRIISVQLRSTICSEVPGSDPTL